MYTAPFQSKMMNKANEVTLRHQCSKILLLDTKSRISKFLKSSQNKTEFIRFLVKQWQTDEYQAQLGQTSMYLGFDNVCVKITEDSCEDIQELFTDHEEADT